METGRAELADFCPLWLPNVFKSLFTIFEQFGAARSPPPPKTREQKRHIKLWHIKLCPVTSVTGPPGRVSGQKDLCSLGSEDST